MMNELALFAGAGGGLLATTHLLKWNTICYVEWDAYCVSVLKQRIADGYLHDAPIWDDVQTFDGHPWVGCVDIVTAGFPCQPFSETGLQLGIEDDRNMWPSTIRIIRESKPPFLLLENVTGLLSTMDQTAKSPYPYAGVVFADLAQSGYDATWRVLSAAEVGAPHKRDRLFIVAHSNQINGHPGVGTQQDWTSPIQPGVDQQMLRDNWLQTVARNAGSYNGMAHSVDRSEAIGNGQVPAVVATVWRMLTGG